jgi:formylmethanofuran dehydrogenase subunit C
MPVPVPELSLVYAEGLRQVNSTGPLRGTGVLVVDGDLEILAGSNSYFKGLIYVTGNLTLKAPSLVHGTIIVEGTITMTGLGDTTEVIYAEDVLDELRLEMGGYRITRPLLRVDPALTGGPK